MVDTTHYERWKFPSELIPVSSRMMRALRYDDGARLLEIVFKNGRIYQFVSVPPEQYRNLLNAVSKGRYFQENLRGKYPYWRLHRAKPWRS
jgi:hypothetical protein